LGAYSNEHFEQLRAELSRTVGEVPLYAAYGRPDDDLQAWLNGLPLVSKKELRRGFPKSVLRASQDLGRAMQDQQVTVLATSGTTSDRLQVLWEWTWWDPQEREAMRLNARVAKSLGQQSFREAVLTTPACGGGTCHIGPQSLAERTVDGMLFFNQSPDPSHWTEAETARMIAEWRDFSPRGLEADPAYLATLCRAVKARHQLLPAPDFVALTYETTTRAHRRDISRALDAPLYQLYGATEAGALLMECEQGLLHPNHRHAHVDLIPLASACGALARIAVTTLGREWMPLIRYDLGDVVRVSAQAECSCGLPARGPLLERIEGRFSDCTEVSGQLVTPLVLDDAIMQTALADQIQQWQLAGDVLSVLGPGDAAMQAAAAAGKLLERPIRGESVSAIAPEASGKYRLVRA
jgi:phenylacetate-CoA ligase